MLHQIPAQVYNSLYLFENLFVYILPKDVKMMKRRSHKREREWISSLWDLCLVESQIRKKKWNQRSIFSRKKRRIAAVCLVENEIGAPTQARAQSNARKERMALFFFFSNRKTFDFLFLNTTKTRSIMNYGLSRWCAWFEIGGIVWEESNKCEKRGGENNHFLLWGGFFLPLCELVSDPPLDYSESFIY